MYKSYFENIDKRYKNRMDVVISDIVVGGFNGKIVSETRDMKDKQNQMIVDFKNINDANNAYEELQDIRSINVVQEQKRIWVSWK